MSALSNAISSLTSSTSLFATTASTAAANADTDAKFSSQPSDVGAWKKLFTTCPRESAEVIEAPDLPSDLVGTFYRNGGAKYEVGNEKVIHPFDSDG